MRIATIKHNTNPELFMKIEDIEAILEELLGNIQSKYMISLEKLLEEEMSQSGGLDEYSFCFNGNLPLRQEAGEICSDISSLKREISSLKEKILLAAKRHHLKEFKQLSLKIDEHIGWLEEQQGVLREESLGSEKLVKNQIGSSKRYDEAIKALQEEIELYSRKKSIIDREISDLKKRMG